MKVDADALAAMIAAAEEAGRRILAIGNGKPERREKPDASPVTEADLAAEAILIAALARLFPDIPVIAEEWAAQNGLPEGKAPPLFFLVDPLDGTKEFLAGNGEFTVNIALIEDGAPRFGLIHLPATGETFFTKDGGAWRKEGAEDARPIAARFPPAEGLTLMVSRSHRARNPIESGDFGERVAAILAAGSSLKFCRLAEGKADLYPRTGPTMEWDIAAGHAILAAAGGSVVTQSGEGLRYGKVESAWRNPAFFARGRR